MLMPKKVKYRKQQRGRRNGKAWRGGELSFGEYGLKALEPAWITDRQIEASRVAITRFIKRGGKLWIRIFPDKPFTKKPAETRMGKGKGAPEFWVAVVKPGRIHVRDGRRGSGHGQRGHATGSAQAADSHEVCDPRGELVMAKSTEKMRDLGTPELEARERELAEQVFRLRFQLATGQAEAVTKLRLARKDRARVKTLLRERELRKDNGR